MTRMENKIRRDAIVGPGAGPRAFAPDSPERSAELARGAAIAAL